jgi:tripartite ATP-independent transporter DctM subunit
VAAGAIFIVVFVVLAIPIAIAIILGSFIGLAGLEQPMYIVSQRIFNQLSSSAFLAIPFFVFAGDLMERSGMAARLVGSAKALFGHFRGGLPQASVGLALGLSGVSGSSVADAAFQSRVLVPQMRAEGYSASWSAAVVAAGATIGPIFPPSVAMVIYAALTAIPVGPLFLGGVVPGVLLAMTFMVTVAIQTRDRPRGRWVGPVATLRAFRSAFWGLLAPVIIVVGITGGAFSATEAGAILVLYVLFVGTVIYRSLSIRAFFGAILQSAITTGAVMLTIAAAAILAWLLGYIGVATKIGDWLSQLPGPTWVVVVSIAGFLVLGTFVDENALGILMIPVLHPIVTDLGVDPVYFAVLIVLSIVAGAITPPVGVLLFVTSSVTGVPLAKLSRSILPFCLAIVIVIALCIAFPPLITWLPDLAY